MLPPAIIKPKIEGRWGKSPSGCSDGEGRAVLTGDRGKVMVRDSCATSSSKRIRTMPALLFMTGLLFLVFSFLITSFIEFRIETKAYL